MPPLVGVAVKVTLVPAQMLVSFAVTITDGETELLTVMVTVLLVAVAVVWQVPLAVNTQVNWSPFAKVEVLYDADVAPLILLPFFLH